MAKHILKKFISLRGLFALFLLLLLSTNLGWAQKQQNNSASNMTPYERKMVQINRLAVQRYGLSDALTLSILNEGFLELSIDALKLQGLRTAQDVRQYQMASWYLAQLREAKKLWSKVDEEKKRRLAEEKRQREALQVKAEEEAKRKAEEERRKEEAERIMRRAHDLLMASGYENLTSDISRSFNKWQAKGEFEKRADYDQRLKDSSVIVLNRMCSKSVQELEENWENEFLDNSDRQLQIGGYDIDQEIYPIYIKRNQGRENFYDFTGSFQCPADIARKISDHTYRIDVSNFHLAMCSDGILLDSIRVRVLDKNNKIVLSKTAHNDNKARAVSPLEIRSSSLDIQENPYVKGYAYVYKSPMRQSRYTLSKTSSKTSSKEESEVILKKEILKKAEPVIRNVLDRLF